MARIWTERRIASPGVLKADDLNVEMAAAGRQINGNLDQHNLPLGSVSSGKLVQGTLEAGSHTKSTFLACNSYHRSVVPQAGLTTANITINPEDADLSGGWRSIAAYLDDDGFVLEFEARDGMIHGHAVLDWEMRTSFNELSAGPTNPATHHQDTMQVGVFVNGILVADSGKIHPRRLTLDLPFSCPAPAGPCTIETKFRAFVRQYAAAGTDLDPGAGVNLVSYPAGSFQYPDIKFHGAAIYARNQYR